MRGTSGQEHWGSEVEIERLRRQMKDGKLAVAARLLVGSTLRGLMHTHFTAWKDDIAQATCDAQENSLNLRK